MVHISSWVFMLTRIFFWTSWKLEKQNIWTKRSDIRGTSWCQSNMTWNQAIVLESKGPLENYEISSKIESFWIVGIILWIICFFTGLMSWCFILAISFFDDSLTWFKGKILLWGSGLNYLNVLGLDCRVSIFLTKT